MSMVYIHIDEGRYSRLDILDTEGSIMDYGADALYFDSRTIKTVNFIIFFFFFFLNQAHIT